MNLQTDLALLEDLEQLLAKGEVPRLTQPRDMERLRRHIIEYHKGKESHEEADPPQR